MKKTIIAAAAALFVVFSLSGCGGNDESNEEAYIPAVPAAEEAPEVQSEAPSPERDENYDAERIVADLFKENATNEEDIKKLFATLPGINWSEYERYTDGKAMDLIQWLYRRGMTDSEEILSIMNATDGLDGAFSEGYAAILDNAFMNGPEDFIKCLAQLDSAKAERVDAYVAYDCDWGGREEVKPAIITTKELMAGSELTDTELKAAEQLLRTIEAGSPG